MSGEQEVYEIKEEKGEALVLNGVAYFMPHCLDVPKFVNYTMDTML